MARSWGLNDRRKIGLHMASADDRPLSRREKTGIGAGGALIGWLIIGGLVYLFLKVFT